MSILNQPVTVQQIEAAELRFLRDRLAIVKIREFALNAERKQIEARIAEIEGMNEDDRSQDHDRDLLLYGVAYKLRLPDGSDIRLDPAAVTVYRAGDEEAGDEHEMGSR